MMDRGFPLKDMSSALKNLSNPKALKNAMLSSKTGAGVAEITD